MNYLLAFFGASLSISISAAQATAAVLMLICLLLFLRGEQKDLWRTSPLLLPLVVYSFWSALASAIGGSENFWQGLGEFDSFLLYFLIAHGLSRQKWAISGRWFLIASVVMGLVGCVQAFSGVSYNPTDHTFQVPVFFQGFPGWLLHVAATRSGRATGFRSHPLTYAECLLPAFLLLAGWVGVQVFQEKKSLKSLVKEIAGVGLILGGIVVSQSRGVWLGGLAGFLYLIRRWPGRVQGMLLIGFVAVAGGVFAVSPHYRARALSIVSNSSGSLPDQQSTATRLDLWRQSVQQIEARPILGNGLDGTELTTIDPATNRPRIWSESHNMFLQAALDSGLVGLGMFIWILFVSGRMILKLMDPWRRIYMAIFVALLIAGITESWPHDSTVSMVMWAMMGFVERLRPSSSEVR